MSDHGKHVGLWWQNAVLWQTMAQSLQRQTMVLDPNGQSDVLWQIKCQTMAHSAGPWWEKSCIMVS